MFVKPPGIEELRLTRRRAKFICGEEDKGSVRVFSVRETMTHQVHVWGQVLVPYLANTEGGVRSNIHPNATDVHTPKLPYSGVHPAYTWSTPWRAFKRRLRDGGGSYKAARWVAYRWENFVQEMKAYVCVISWMTQWGGASHFMLSWRIFKQKCPCLMVDMF